MVYDTSNGPQNDIGNYLGPVVGVSLNPNPRVHGRVKALLPWARCSWAVQQWGRCVSASQVVRFKVLSHYKTRVRV